MRLLIAGIALILQKVAKDAKDAGKTKAWWHEVILSEA